MHERAVEQRVALAQKRHVTAGFEMRGDRDRALFVEARQRIAVGRSVEMRFVGHGVKERQLDMRGLEPAVSDRARVAAPPGLGEEGDDRRCGDDLVAFTVSSSGSPGPIPTP